MRPTFDDRDREILDARVALLAKNPINVGDFVKFRSGIVRRVSYIWTATDERTPESIQTSDDGSFYLGDGYVSFSGALYQGVPFGELVDTGDTHDGHAWFFHHDHACADNGVRVEVKFCVWRCDRDAEGS